MKGTGTTKIESTILNPFQYIFRCNYLRLIHSRAGFPCQDSLPRSNTLTKDGSPNKDASRHIKSRSGLVFRHRVRMDSVDTYCHAHYKVCKDSRMCRKQEAFFGIPFRRNMYSAPCFPHCYWFPTSKKPAEWRDLLLVGQRIVPYPQVSAAK